MHFKDLTNYSYSREHVRPGLLNVGWLDIAHSFPIHPPSHEFVKSLWLYCKYSVAIMRGFHSCEFCSPNAEKMVTATLLGEEVDLGYAEIRVFGQAEQAFASPNLIFHYVTKHHYQPPTQFINAIDSGPRPGTTQYDILLDKYSEDEDRLYRRLRIGPSRTRCRS